MRACLFRVCKRTGMLGPPQCVTPLKSLQMIALGGSGASPFPCTPHVRLPDLALARSVQCLVSKITRFAFLRTGTRSNPRHLGLQVQRQLHCEPTVGGCSKLHLRHHVRVTHMCLGGCSFVCSFVPVPLGWCCWLCGRLCRMNACMHAPENI